MLTSARQLPQHGRLLCESLILRGAQHVAAFLRGHEIEGARARQREDALAGDGEREVQARQALPRDDNRIKRVEGKNSGYMYSRQSGGARCVEDMGTDCVKIGYCVCTPFCCVGVVCVVLLYISHALVSPIICFSLPYHMLVFLSGVL